MLPIKSGKMSQLLVLCFVLFLPIVICRVGFIKDQSIDRIEFPPRIHKTHDSIVPPGHMRPLGWQKKPDGKVPEEKMTLRPQEFYGRFVRYHKPVVFRGMMGNVPAMETWDKDSYLKTEYGDLNVHVMVKKEKAEHDCQHVTFKKFLKEYNYEDWYMSNTLPQEMAKELMLPTPLKCGLKKYLLESEVWFSSGGTASMLHAHADHNLHCMFAGRKDFILVDQKHKDKVHFIPDAAHPGQGHSLLDSDRINMFDYKEVAQIPWTWSTLKPGDCIFIPAGYLHQVRSYGRSFSSTFLFAPSPSVDFSDCSNIVDYKTPVPLTDVPFMWTYIDGKRQLSSAKMNANRLRHHLEVFMRNETSLGQELFEDVFEDATTEHEDKHKGKIEHNKCHEAWTTLAKGDKTVTEIDRDVVMALDDATLDKVAAYFNKELKRPNDEL